MEFHVIPSHIEPPSLLDEDGFLRILPASAYDAIPQINLLKFCGLHGRYGIPTAELVAWLKERIAGKLAIEIGAGSGDLAHALNIPATDNRMQEWPTIRRYYKLVGQPVIRYPELIQTLDAVDAVHNYRPDVVIGSWVTQWVDPALPCPPGGGNSWGVKEHEILATGCTYILIGNEKVHGDKHIMKQPHRKYAFDFLRSRSLHPELNRVWVWNG